MRTSRASRRVGESARTRPLTAVIEYESALSGTAGNTMGTSRKRTSEEARGAWESDSPPASHRSKAARPMAPLTTAIGAAALIAAAVLSMNFARQNFDASSSTSAVGLAAQRIRERALRACDDQKWQECLEGLNAARSLDPSGEADARVRDARRDAQFSLGQQAP
jgi:hypothetical protein